MDTAQTMASSDLSRKRFLQLCGGAVALGVTGCDSGDGGGDSGTDGGSSSGGATGPTTDPTTDPTTGSTTDPTTDGTTSGSSSGGEGSSSGGEGSSSGGEGSTGGGSSTGEGSSSSTGPGEMFCENGAEAIAVDLHNHDLTISADQLQADTPLAGLDLTGVQHSHTVDLSAADVNALLAGEEITVTSSSDNNHSHQVTIACS